MPGLVRKCFDSPEEVRKLEGDSGHIELVNLDAWQGFVDYAKP
jgi:hypothetical protein